jgi:hypothetical protein
MSMEADDAKPALGKISRFILSGLITGMLGDLTFRLVHAYLGSTGGLL